MKIQFKIHHRFLFFRWTEEITRFFPSSWNEISLFHLLTFCQVKSLKKAKLALSFRFMKIRPQVFFKMNKLYAKQLAMVHNFWFEKEPCFSKVLVKKFSISFRTYYGPDDGYTNILVMENAIADGYFIKYMKEKKDEDLCIMIAALYRPTNVFIRLQRLINGRDIRYKFNKDDVERRAKRFSNLSHVLKEALLIQFTGNRNDLVNQYKDLFTAGEQKGIRNYGWGGIIHDLAGTKMGSMKTVEKEPLRDVLFVLRKMEDDRKRRESVTPKKAAV